MQDPEAGKPERRNGQREVVFVEALAFCLLQAKNTIQPGLQQAQGGWGCAYVCLLPQTQQLEAGRPREGSTALWGGTGGQEGVWFAVHMSECMCAGF